MLDSLTVVVTCTDRKSARPNKDFTVSSLPGSSTADRVGQWVERIDSARPSVRLRDLYRGDSWSQALTLETSALTTARRVRMLVASAGLGLRDIDSASVPYSATFSPGKADSVGSGASQMSEWWHGLESSEAALSMDAALDGPTLLVLSSAYARAMGTSLAALEGREDVLTFGGDDASSAGIRIRADRTLRYALGGTAMTLNLRSAIKWIEINHADNIFSRESQSRWQEWSETASRPDTFDRLQQSDNDIKQWMTSITRAKPDISRSAALREYRQAGLACEQRRFATLFGAVRDAS